MHSDTPAEDGASNDDRVFNILMCNYRIDYFNLNTPFGPLERLEEMLAGAYGLVKTELKNWFSSNLVALKTSR